MAVGRGRGEKTRQVRQLAARYGVTERTVWRHHAAGTLHLLTAGRDVRTCEYCGSTYVPITSWQRFCSETHRIYSHRRPVS